ncbi:integral membrane sensor signal transduction histidine kinase [Anaeromyxobacter sp. K]|uniref:sensor histidine kinase n=1 Tax=Anaeromyxobacter sp. (strain K) TaxID=447217 RepID=UPI00015F897D|nr:HAMP domain-containing sensor histidine kinase [Anaeromyxobacter sp. K]ACG72116.1 integral membrane sensor signal transduction histidine kinase [Anaeromyxobacter sp. K]
MPPPGHDQIQREELSRLFGQLVGARLLLVPLLVGTGAWIAWEEPAGWRRALLGGLLVPVAAFFIVEYVRFRRRGGLAPGQVRLNLSVAVIAQMLLTAATGGLQSPFVYVSVLLAVIVNVFVRPPVSSWLTAFQVVAVWALAAVGAAGAAPLEIELLGGAARRPVPVGLWLHAALLTIVLVAIAFAGRAGRKVFEAIIRRALAAQQDSLRAYAERAEELTALSGEIAHELKNPLASVKGLAGLLAQGVGPGKPTERLAVLRQEVDRMQTILDGFLNFSRPLVPLVLDDCDVAALAREVAALHEGLARERGVALEPRGAGVRARCDPRKVKQILVNLVQNALDASPAGAAVELEATPVRGGGARILVQDRGPGLDPAVRDAAFSPGFTTKASGSGLGLTIARSLARQHGGDLVLSPRTGGGMVAELTLPATPAGAGTGAVA